jgi:site-specific DNA recombinase
MRTPEKKLLSLAFRTSGLGQKKEETIEIQMEAARRFLESDEFLRSGFELSPRYPDCDPMDPWNHFVDDGYNLETWKPDSAIAALLKSIQAGRTHVVWCYNSNRLFRSQSAEITGKILDCMKIYRVCLYDRTGLKPPDIGLKILAILGTEEKASIVTRLHDSKMFRAREDGRPPNGKCPYGYAYDKEKRTWVVVPEEAKIIRMIATLSSGVPFEPLPPSLFHLEGQALSDPEIADALNKAGFDRLGYMVRNRFNVWMQKNPAGKFDESFIMTILRSDRYNGKDYYAFKKCEDLMHPLAIGQRREEKRMVTIERPPILTAEEYGLLKPVRQRRRFVQEKHRNQTHQYLLDGLLRCGTCGRRMAVRVKWPKRRNDAPYNPTRYYQCQRKKHIDHRCETSNYQNASVIEDVVWKRVCSVITNPNLLALLDESAKGEVSEQNLMRMESLLRDKEAQRNHIRRRIEHIESCLVREVISEAGGIRERKEAEQELETIERGISEVKAEIAMLQNKFDRMEKLDLAALKKRYESRLQDLTFKEQNQIVKMLVTKIEVTPGLKSNPNAVRMYFRGFGVE